MRFIEGIGYIDDTTAYQATNATKQAATASFDEILSVETAKVAAADNETTSQSLDDIFHEAAQTYGISYDLLKAIAYNESGFRADATSYVGAMGIMQLMPDTARSLGVTNAYDPYQNIMGGAKYLSQLSNMFDGNYTMMIAAYNAGPGNVAKYGGIPPFTETQNYVAKVLNTLTSGSPDADNAKLYSAYRYSQPDGLAFQSKSYTKEMLDSIFSYDDYQTLLSYFDFMLKMLDNI